MAALREPKPTSRAQPKKRQPGHAGTRCRGRFGRQRLVAETTERAEASAEERKEADGWRDGATAAALREPKLTAAAIHSLHHSLHHSLKNRILLTKYQLDNFVTFPSLVAGLRVRLWLR